jgi:L-fuconolactonase
MSRNAAPTIDAHQHFWRYDRREYPWIGESMTPLQRDFLPEDLEPELERAGVDGTVAVQARQSPEETRWLLDLAGRHSWIEGVVGWVPLMADDLAAHLETYCRQDAFVGARHVLQDEPDPTAVMSDPAFNAGIAELTRRKLRYDLLIHERHLPEAIALVSRHPQQTFILDHAAKPRIAEGLRQPWERNIREMARRENVYCKLSGLVTEADARHWTPGQLRGYMDAVLHAFGPERILFGSDWPVVTVATDYATWHGLVQEFVAALSRSEQSRILGGTATAAYGLPPTRASGRQRRP